MNPSNEAAKPLIFCLDKSVNSNLKQCFYNFYPRFFTDGKSLLKNLVLSKKTEFIPKAFVLTGEQHTIKDILSNANLSSTIKIFLFCPDSSRQTYETFMIDSKYNKNLMGLFTTIEDLRDALEDLLIQPKHHRDSIRFITDNLDGYLWYEFLRQTSMKIPTVSAKQTIDIPNVNRQIEYDPLITLYTLRSSIRNLSERTVSHKKIFYGTVIKTDLIEKFQSNLNNLICFHSFVHLQGHQRSLDARQQALQCCSRRSDEVSVLFELELANQPTFKIIRIFNSNDSINLWVIQLIGTHECVKLIKQFSHLKRTMTSLYRWQQPEILFGSILIEMDEKLLAHRFFFEILINQYDRLNKIYTKAKDLWKNEGNYQGAIELIAYEFQQIKSLKSNQRNEEFTYLESEFDSIWETPLALEDAEKVNDLLAPIAYRMDQVLCSGSIIPKSTPTTATSPNKHRCILL